MFKQAKRNLFLKMNTLKIIVECFFIKKLIINRKYQMERKVLSNKSLFLCIILKNKAVKKNKLKRKILIFSYNKNKLKKIKEKKQAMIN